MDGHSAGVMLTHPHTLRFSQVFHLIRGATFHLFSERDRIALKVPVPARNSFNDSNVFHLHILEYFYENNPNHRVFKNP